MVRFWIVGRDPLRRSASSSTTATTCASSCDGRAVLGLARSGARRLRGALRARGDEVRRATTATPDVDVDAVSDARALRLGSWDEHAPRRSRRSSSRAPGCPARRRSSSLRAHAGIPVDLRDRARRAPAARTRSSVSPGRTGRRRRRRCSGRSSRPPASPAEVAGNIGRPLTSLVGSPTPDAWVVCELSSFQLEDVDTLRPRIAVLLNLEPDHLDRHGSLRGLRDAKLPRLREPGPGRRRRRARGLRHRSRAPRDASSSRPTIRCPPSRASRARTTARTPPPRRQPPVPPGIADEAIARRAPHLPGRRAPHRGRSAELGGVRYVNDSKATNVAAALRAIASFPGAAARDPRWSRQARELRAARRRVRRAATART